MFSSLQNYIYQIQNDSLARRRFFVTIGIFVGLMLFGFFVIFLVLRDDSVSTSRNPFDTELRVDYDLVTDSSFNNNQGLVELYQTPALDSGVIGNQGDIWAYINRDLKLTINGEVIENNPVITPRSVYVDQGVIIVNGIDQTYLYNGVQSEPFIDRAYSLVPSLITNKTNVRNTPGYMFLLANQKQVFLFETTSITEDVSVNQIGLLNLDNNEEFAEIRVLNSQPYVVVYSDITRTGDIDIYRIADNNKTTKAIALQNVESISFSRYGVMYTQLSDNPTELSKYSSSVVDFSQDPMGEVYSMDVQPRIAQQGVFGSLWAERCDFDTAQSVTCLMKIRKVIHTDSSQQDRIVRYNFVDDTLEYPYSNVFLSGDRIFYDLQGNTFVLGQFNNIIYQLDEAQI